MYMNYLLMKCIILAINVYLHSIIFKAALIIGTILKTCIIVSCTRHEQIAVTTTQVVVTTYNWYLLFVRQPKVALMFSAMNSYQVVAITGMFVFLLQNQTEKPPTTMVTRKLIKQNVSRSFYSMRSRVQYTFKRSWCLPPRSI